MGDGQYGAWQLVLQIHEFHGLVIYRRPMLKMLLWTYLQMADWLNKLLFDRHWAGGSSSLTYCVMVDQD